MKVSLVILNFNTTSETIEILKSLKNQSDQQFNVVIIDNSTDLEEKKSLESFISINLPDITYKPSISNLGFSGGVNLGINESLKNGAEWAILLNNDLTLNSNFISALKPYLSDSKSIIGIPLAENGKTAFCGKIKWLKPTLPHIYNEPQLSTLDSRFYAIGGAMAIHKNVIDKIGFLDENYFLYFEDADFSMRAHKHNIPITIANDLVIKHSVSASAKKLGSSKLLYYHYRNALRFNSRQGSAFIRMAAHIWSLLIVIKQLIKILLGFRVEESRFILRAVIDFYRNNFGILKNQ